MRRAGHPVIVGDLDTAALGDLIRLCAQLDKLQHGPGDPGQDTGDQDTGDYGGTAGGDGDGSLPDTAAGSGRSAGPDRSRQALVQAIIGKAVELLSGPGGVASHLRRKQFDDELGGPSLPLDIGYSKTVPAGIRNAVRLRGKHCEWAGGCRQPAGACQVHHTRHKADGGETSVKGCVLLCWYHHQVMIHQRGWTLVVNPDGTATAWNKDKTKVLHSHGPPAPPGKVPLSAGSEVVAFCGDRHPASGR